ncbi:MAG: tetratricopeptide repeat protein [bacterium]
MITAKRGRVSGVGVRWSVVAHRSRACEGVALRLHHHAMSAIASLRRLRKLMLPALLLSLLLTAIPLRATTTLPEDERRFLWDEANTALAHARTPAEFSTSARHFEALSAAGIQNGTLFYNLGTAYLQAGRYEDARRALERAERYEGTAPDIQRNLLAAFGGAQKNRQPYLPWDRSVFIWHYVLSCKVRALLAAALFSLAWLLLALGRAIPGARVRWPALLAFAASFAIATSVLTSVLADNHPAYINFSTSIIP